MHSGLIEFLQEKQILYYKKFGFQKDFSTNHVISNLLESIQKALETEKNEKTVCGIFIDPEKVLDTVNYDILF